MFPECASGNGGRGESKGSRCSLNIAQMFPECSLNVRAEMAAEAEAEKKAKVADVP
jgi:hypothetical protein